jgi:acetylornithine deacetylase
VPSIDRGDPLVLARALVAVDSRNPSLSADGPGERACAELLATVLRDWGFRVDLLESSAGRPNVVARIGSTDRAAGGRSLILNGHLDTVGVEGMTHAPWEPALRAGRLYGRGSTDMKSGVAAMCAAAARAASAPGGLRGEVIITAVTDEEFESEGTATVLAAGIRADAAIVTEPTRLAVVPAHRGFAWLDLIVHGRAAHGSRYDVGIDAITLAALVIAELEHYQGKILVKRTHPLLGRPSFHASMIDGGIGLSTYPDRCRVQFERRTLPGETASDFTREVEEACARVRAKRPELSVEIIPGFSQHANEVARDAPIVRALTAAYERTTGAAASIDGLACWTDAALLSAAGVPAICFGPGDIALAHAAEEYVAVDEIHRATDVLSALITDWCGSAR